MSLPIRVLAPLLTVYGLFLVALVAAARRDKVRHVRSRQVYHSFTPHWSHFARYILRLTVAGYVLFLAIVAVFHSALGGEGSEVVPEAALSGAVLVFLVAVPAFIAINWVRALLARRRARSSR